MSEWKITLLGSVVSQVTHKVALGKDPTKPYIGLEHIPSDGASLIGAGKADDSISANNVFRSGDILFGKLRPRLRKCVQVDFQGYCSTDILVLRANDETNALFASMLLSSNAVFTEAIRTEEGTKMPRCSWRSLRNLQLPCPAPPQQRRIASILTTLDEEIAATESLIVKYQQIKAGLMHDLFTRGLWTQAELSRGDHKGTPAESTAKPNHLRPTPEQAPQLYQDSPIGLVPKSWQVALLDSLAKRGSGHTPNRHTPSFWDGAIKWVSLADSSRLDQLYISETDKEISLLGIENSSAVLHPPGIVILSRDAGVGKSAITTCPMAVSQHFMCWLCGPQLDNHFLYYWLQDKKRVFENISTGTTIPTIGLGFFQRYRIAAPTDINEQLAIRSSLLAIDDDIFAHKTHLTKLRQQKQGLMHDLLTGRVRVG